MASLTKRTITLVVSETLKYSFQFLSPILLVRILDKEIYGQYREFIVYSSLVLTFISFSIQGNLIYFISKDPDREKDYVSNTAFLLFFIHVLGIIVVHILRDNFRNLTTLILSFLLMIYIFICQYLDLIENYWLGKKRTDLVLYWSTTNVVIRTVSIILVAYLTGNIYSIIYVFVFHELAKSSFTFIILKKKKVLSFSFNKALAKEQFVYIIPLGLSIVIFNFDNDISKIIISANLGASALAIYAIGSQNIPLINIVVSSVTNVIFPEMAQKASTNPLESLSLWNKSNLLYLFLMLPVFFIFFYYAEEFITTLFTSQYIDAVVLFRIYLLVMLRKCFEMSTPLRAMNKNKYFIIGNLISLVVNVIMLFILFKLLGFVGPAIAYVVTEFSSLIYLSFKIISTYNIKLSEMLLWKKTGIILLVGISCLPVLFAGNLLTMNPIAIAIIFSFIYVLIYLLIMRKLKIEEVDIFMKKILKGVKLSW